MTDKVLEGAWDMLCPSSPYLSLICCVNLRGFVTTLMLRVNLHGCIDVLILCLCLMCFMMFNFVCVFTLFSDGWFSMCFYMVVCYFVFLMWGMMLIFSDVCFVWVFNCFLRCCMYFIVLYDVRFCICFCVVLWWLMLYVFLRCFLMFDVFGCFYVVLLLLLILCVLLHVIIDATKCWRKLQSVIDRYNVQYNVRGDSAKCNGSCAKCRSRETKCRSIEAKWKGPHQSAKQTVR